MGKDTSQIGASVFPFAEILQHYGQTGRTGLFVIGSGEQKSFLYLMSGIVAHAETEILSGETAVYDILNWENPEYEWEDAVTPTKMTMSGTVQDLLLKAIQIGNSGELEQLKQNATHFQKTRNISKVSEFMVSLAVSSEELPSFDYPVSTKQVRVGRHPENDLVLPDTSVSRKHALIIVNQDTLLVRDLGSMNGIKIDGYPLTQGLARNGQMIQIGEVNLEVAIAALEPTRTMVRFG